MGFGKKLLRPLAAVRQIKAQAGQDQNIVRCTAMSLGPLAQVLA